MLCAIPSTNKVAVLAEPNASGAACFLDMQSLQISSTSASSTVFDGVFPFGNKFIAWSKQSEEVHTFSSTGAEESRHKIPHLANLQPFGESEEAEGGALVAYLTLPAPTKQHELVLLDGTSLERVRLIKMLRSRSADSSATAPAQLSCHSRNGKCVLFTKGPSTVVGFRDLVGEEGEQFFTLKLAEHKTCLAVWHELENTTICCGLESGKIIISRFGADCTKAVTSELHWHSSAVRCLTLINDSHLLSGGNEGTLVMWKMDQGSQTRDYRPRLGAPIASTCLAQDGQAACVLLQDGTMIQVNLPQMNVICRKIHCWTPKTTTLLVRRVDGREIALYDESFHAPGLIRITSRFPHEEDVEHIIDVAHRNAVSSSSAAHRWKLSAAKFSPNGAVLACLLSSQNKHEARIFLHEQECLRVSLAQPPQQQQPAVGKELQVLNAVICVTNRACAIVDPNSPNKLVMLHLVDKVWATQTVLDLAPQTITSVSLSDDESCVACLCASGLVRVFDRKTGAVVLTHALHISSSSAAAGVSFAKHSREVYAWNSNRVDALVSKQSLVDVDIVFASAENFVDSIGLLVARKQGEEEEITLNLWNARSGGALQRVSEVRARADLEQFQFAGKELGWLVKTRSRGWEVEASAAALSDDSSNADRLVLGGMRKLPGITLRAKQEVEASNAAGRGLLSNNAVPEVAEWCHDLPSHLLHNPPPLQLVWPTWGAKSREQQSQQQQQHEKDDSVANTTKRAKVAVVAVDAAVSKTAVVVQDQSEQERAAFQALFNALH